MKRDKLGRFIKGQHYSVATQFKKNEQLGNKHPFWKGGRYKLKNGYIWAYAPTHPRAYRNGIYEHILIAEKKLGRYLKKGETVHHINGIKDDNQKKNIIVFPNNGEHMQGHLKNRKRDCKKVKRDSFGRIMKGSKFKWLVG